MAQVIDYSWARPAPQAIAAAGYIGAIRYLRGRGKSIDRAELDALHAHGLAVGFVEETTASRAAAGFDAGRADAVAANQVGDALGVPDWVPIRYAVDFDASGPQVQPYFEGALSAAGRPVSSYGSYRVTEHLANEGLTVLPWQCAAWSGTGQGSGGTRQGRRLSAHACLFQLVGYVLGDTSDANDVLAADWGGWHPNTPQSAPGAPTTSQEDDMPASVLVLNPDADGEWWECFTGSPERRRIPTVFGTAEIDILHYLGSPILDQADQVDARRFWLNARTPVVTMPAGTVDPAAIADQLEQRLGQDLAKAVRDEFARRPLTAS